MLPQRPLGELSARESPDSATSSVRDPDCAWAGFSGPTGQRLPGGHTPFLAIDALAPVVSALPGFKRLPDVDGHASVAFPVAPVPALAGLELHFGLVVIAPGGGAEQAARSPTAPVESDPWRFTSTT